MFWTVFYFQKYGEQCIQGVPTIMPRTTMRSENLKKINRLSLI